MFELEINSYNKITKLLKISGLILLLISITNHFFIIRDLKPLDKKNALIEFCNFVTNARDLETINKLKNIEKTLEYCNNIDVYQGYFDLMNLNTPDEYSDDDFNLMIINYSIFFIGTMLLFKGFFGLKIYKHFNLNDYEESLFFWIQDLKNSQRINNIDEFDNWLKGFESRYSKREIEVMKLNFKIK